MRFTAFFIYITAAYGLRKSPCTSRRPCGKCENRDCDVDADCKGKLLCADAHKDTLTRLGLDPRKASCDASIGLWHWELCFDPSLIDEDKCNEASDCGDGDVCNGEEICDPIKGCKRGTPLDCDDSNRCTIDRCNAVKGCSNTPVVCRANESCDRMDGLCKPLTPLTVACNFLGLNPLSVCLRTTTFVGNAPVGNRIPTELGLLTQLEWLGLNGFGLKGTIPTTLGNLTKLRILNLGNNELKGTVPLSFGNLTRLTDLNLGGNALRGAVPSSLCTAGRTMVVDCGEVECTCCQSLGGEICPSPIDLGMCDKAGACDDGDVCNGVETCDPIEGCKHGTALDCDDSNRCTIDRCNAVSGCSNTPVVCRANESCDRMDGLCKPLTPLTVACNFLGLNPLTVCLRTTTSAGNTPNGISIPTELGLLTQLEWLGLNGFGLKGTIPTTLGNLTKLRILNLGNNELTGIIPQSFSNLTLLTNLNLDGNALIGTVPSSLCSAGRSIVLDCNEVACSCCQSLSGEVCP